MKNDDKFLKKYFEYLEKGKETDILQSSNMTSNSKEETHKKIEKINSELKEKEHEQKRILRNKCFILISKLIWAQLIFFNSIIIIIIIPILLRLPIFNIVDSNMSHLMIDFLRFYIGATIVEILGMLFFIVRFVFSSNIQ